MHIARLTPSTGAYLPALPFDWGALSLTGNLNQSQHIPWISWTGPLSLQCGILWLCSGGRVLWVQRSPALHTLWLAGSRQSSLFLSSWWWCPKMTMIKNDDFGFNEAYLFAFLLFCLGQVNHSWCLTTYQFTWLTRLIQLFDERVGSWIVN